MVPLLPSIAERYRSAGYWKGRTIGSQFHLVAQNYPDNIAVVDSTSQYTYRELDRRTDLIAAGLIDLGFAPGDAVLFQVENSADTVLAWYGVIKAGLIPVATLAAHRGHEIGQIGEATSARGHLVQGDYSKLDLVEFARRMSAESPDSQARIIVTVGRSSHPEVLQITELGRDIGAEQARALVERTEQVIDGDDVAVFQLSGGTTSVPKVIPRLHDEYWYNAVAYAARLGWDDTVRVAHILPVIHNAGIVLGVHAAHSVGAAMVLGTPDPDRFLPLMADSGVTDILFYPALALGWAQHPQFDRAIESLQRVILTGSKVNDESFALFEDRGIRALGLYGAGEGLVMVTPPGAPAAVRQHSVGIPLSELDDVRVFEPGTENEVPDETVGELCFTGPYTLCGYLNSPERNAEAFTSGGLFRSGDLVAARTIAGMRTYTFEGRAKDLVNRGGEKVNSAEIESLVLQIPGVRRAALIPIPDERLGERGCICVEIDQDMAAPTLSDITRFLEARDVAKFKWPERLEVMSLPSTRVGKIDKRALLEEVLAQPAPAANDAASVG
ncbi:AMP-binding protein [Nocardia nova]|uniref:AMP-binding protein n=1 Tax=Nocardia nova TaxID=37330 RepID=UPI0037159243